MSKSAGTLYLAFKILILVCTAGLSFAVVQSASAADLRVQRSYAEPYVKGNGYAYYQDMTPYWVNGYGPFYDCNGSRCYIGAPYASANGYGRSGAGQYYYGPTGGYFRHCASSWAGDCN